MVGCVVESDGESKNWGREEGSYIVDGWRQRRRRDPKVQNDAAKNIKYNA